MRGQWRKRYGSYLSIIIIITGACGGRGLEDNFVLEFGFLRFFMVVVCFNRIPWKEEE